MAKILRLLELDSGTSQTKLNFYRPLRQKCMTGDLQQVKDHCIIFCLVKLTGKHQLFHRGVKFKIEWSSKNDENSLLIIGHIDTQIENHVLEPYPIPLATNSSALQRLPLEREGENVIRGKIAVHSSVNKETVRYDQNTTSSFLNCRNPGPFDNIENGFVPDTPHTESQNEMAEQHADAKFSTCHDRKNEAASLP